ncbi:MAG: hypothetical protein V1799_21880 [bacterium]
MKNLIEILFGEMIGDHWFWATLTVICLIWYSTITVYVAYKGIGDIRGMLERLSNPNRGKDSSSKSEVFNDTTAD